MPTTLEKLPSTFCWAKMGTESGEELSTIIRRKEWERRLGDGHFWWGVGQSLGASGSIAANGGQLPAIFSPIRSKPQAIDVTPAEVVLWNSWVDDDGNAHLLPPHVCVTSRARLPSGRRKERHYALVCMSSRELGDMNNNVQVSPNTLRNFNTRTALGASQVTAVVSHIENDECVGTDGYPISFAVQLEAPYCVRLADPRPLARAELDEILATSRTGDVDAWEKLVRRLRKGPHAEQKNSA